MKKLLALLALLLCVSLSMVVVKRAEASPGDIYVPYNYLTIQAAINAALGGDTIHISGGPYYEHVEVNKTVWLKGEAGAIVDGSGTGTVFNVAVNYVYITNLTIRNSGPDWGTRDSGVKLDQIVYCSILDCHIEGCRLGVYAEDCYHLEVERSTFANNDEAIRTERSTCSFIQDNELTNNDYGIILSTISNLTLVARNNLQGGLSGLHLQTWSNNNTLYGNTVRDYMYGLTLSQSDYTILYHNSFINNTNHVFAPSVLGTAWDMGWPAGGNYWEDHESADVFSGTFQNEPGGDGICDAPYNPYAGATDRYPLKGPCHTYPVQMEPVPEEITVISNSTVTDFSTDADNHLLRFNVSGTSGKGFCRVDLPDAFVSGMWQNNYTVLVNGEPMTFRNWTSRGIVYIYFAYPHSTHEVIIIPESPWLLVLPLLTLTSALAIVRRKKRKMV